MKPLTEDDTLYSITGDHQPQKQGIALLKARKVMLCDKVAGRDGIHLINNAAGESLAHR